jgi:hypothetical protein
LYDCQMRKSLNIWRLAAQMRSETLSCVDHFGGSAPYSLASENWH